MTTLGRGRGVGAHDAIDMTLVHDGPVLIAIGGPAGSGKTTLANAVASRLDCAHLDFDVVTSELVAVGRHARPDLSEAALLADLRAARYRTLARAVDDALRSGPRWLVVSAPFTAEASDAETWRTWTHALPPHTPITFVWINVDPGERRRRMLARGSSRDAELLGSGGPVPAVPEPVIEHRSVDARTPLAAKIEAIVSAIS